MALIDENGNTNGGTRVPRKPRGGYYSTINKAPVEGSQGLQGVQGPQGTRGTQGLQGLQGVQGSQGPMGFKGKTGIQGRIGVQGKQGLQGIHGCQGVQGSTGPAGVQGIQGKRGPIGPTGMQGIQGIQGAQGLEGSQGYIGPLGVQGVQGLANDEPGLQGIQGCQGPQGIQGLTGETGLQGIQGRVGLQGPVGNRGEEGIQGKEGIQGIQGVQGFRGKQGYDGSQGLQGIQGAQGPRGKTGAQGVHGCDGAQGMTGVTGSQGVQGRGGVQGPQGFRGKQGSDGVQGAQGLPGRRGKTGYMGYQGSDGEVGVQGLVGESGAIWDDGVRLSGYNTHLFVYDTTSRMFVPNNTECYTAEDANAWNEEHSEEIAAGTKQAKHAGDVKNSDLLTIRDGAVIKIWLNRQALNAISVDSELTINTYINGVATANTSKVYYTTNSPLTTYISQRNDIDTVVDLTYKTGAWYYSGGLITSGITDDISVNGVTVGNLSDGDVITAGTSLQALLERMLNKVIDVTYHVPTVNATLNPSVNSVIEIGTQLNTSLTYRFVDGYFESSNKELYNDTKFDIVNAPDAHNGKLNAGCSIIVGRYYRNNGVMESNTINDVFNSETSNTYKVVIDYNKSIVRANKNDGRESDVIIPDSSATSNSIKITSKYKMYIGTANAVTIDTVDDEDYYQFTSQDKLSTLKTRWLEYDENTVYARVDSVVGNESIALVIPSSYEIISCKNNLNADAEIATTFYPQNTIEYVNGSKTTTYQVYVVPSTIATYYTNITIRKKNQ